MAHIIMVGRLQERLDRLTRAVEDAGKSVITCTDESAVDHALINHDIEALVVLDGVDVAERERLEKNLKRRAPKAKFVQHIGGPAVLVEQLTGSAGSTFDALFGGSGTGPAQGPGKKQDLGDWFTGGG